MSNRFIWRIYPLYIPFTLIFRRRCTNKDKKQPLIQVSSPLKLIYCSVFASFNEFLNGDSHFPIYQRYLFPFFALFVFFISKTLSNLARFLKKTGLFKWYFKNLIGMCKYFVRYTTSDWRVNISDTRFADILFLRAFTYFKGRSR